MAVLTSFINFFVMVIGNTMDSHRTILDELTISSKLSEVFLVEESDVIIAFVTIVSRSGTDISSAMEKIPVGKPAILIVLHHTFDPNYIAPDSRLCVNKNTVFAVDCLYHEDEGLLRCPRNDDAIRAVKKHLKIDEHNVDNSRINCAEMKSNRCTAVRIAMLILLTGVCTGVGIGVNVVLGIVAFIFLLIPACIVTRIYPCSSEDNNSHVHADSTKYLAI
ncbi:uncharacterized protein LOC124380228 isoform X2 [Silurus meridionalis]|uniref:uncharacterized protein LOC124380228 isoform X2 n=1 Tax=Silurus meridionalis TaxID=175797 RepID=UPI001EEA8666|nr:uncharacterized protein LOC124380228 isoform X2 [Silurus meridionalis]